MTTQPALPLSFAQPLPPRLPELRDAEPCSDYLWRCVAVADRHWREWWQRRHAGQGGSVVTPCAAGPARGAAGAGEVSRAGGADAVLRRPRLLDTFGGAGGCARGYQMAGFHVTGVDHVAQPRYAGDVFIKADALEYIRGHGHEYDAIHASPPCQGYSRMRHLPWLKGREYPMLIEATRDALNATGRPWVIENVEDAPLRGITLCGAMFGLRTYRHRKFEANWLLLGQTHPRHVVRIGPGRRINDRMCATADGWVSVAGHGKGIRAAASAALGIDWMNRDELSQAIPPAFTEYVGLQLRQMIEWEAASAARDGGAAEREEST